MYDLIRKILILLDSIDFYVPYFFERKYSWDILSVIMGGRILDEEYLMIDIFLFSSHNI